MPANDNHDARFAVLETRLAIAEERLRDGAAIHQGFSRLEAQLEHLLNAVTDQRAEMQRMREELDKLKQQMPLVSKSAGFVDKAVGVILSTVLAAVLSYVVVSKQIPGAH